MKLKRLLLRYDPAGIGLECANDAGETSVIHKDLPPVPQEQEIEGEKFTPDVVKQLANTLIDGEPELLSKKKHLQALCQLLCRLYQIEAEDINFGDDKDKKEKKKKKDKDKDKEKDEPTSPKSHGVFKVGDKVLIYGLKPPHQDFNNYIGTIVKLCEKDKVEIVPEGGNEKEPIKAKCGPLLRVQDRPIGSGKSGDIPVGTKVSITRLRNHGALNGTVARVVEFNHATLRYEVRALETGQLFRVKPDNVVPLIDQDYGDVLSDKKGDSLPPTTTFPGVAGSKPKIVEGCIVALCELKNAAWLNGEEAEVLAVDEDRNRLDIKLNHDGSVKKVKCDNVRFVRGPPDKGHSSEDHADEFTPGQIVRLCNLRSAAALNGEKAEIRRKDPGSDRYEIVLELDGSTKKVRKENLQHI